MSDDQTDARAVCVEREAREAREAREVRDVREENVRSVRLGHGANCSSVGSVIDTLFLGAALGGAVFAAVCAAMKVEAITVVGARPPTPPPPPTPTPPPPPPAEPEAAGEEGPT
jgi:hypothetical protein